MTKEIIYTLRRWSDRVRGICQFDSCERSATKSLEYQTAGMEAPRHWFLCDQHASTVRVKP
jgi:hypothetical protein